MAHLRWHLEPDIGAPIIVAAFEGWNDAGDAATSAVRYLRDRFDAEPLAEIDPEEFYDFSQVRPTVHLVDGVTREIEWPVIEITAGAVPGGPDLVFVVGHEPHLRWRTFCDQILEVADRTGATMMITLGSLLAEVSHAAPVSVIGSAYEPGVVERLRLRQSNYEGPTGIVGVLHDACARAGMESASLWAAVPTYVPGAPSPKATLALVQRCAEVLSIGVPTPDLEIASAAYERQVSELVDADDDMRAYVDALEDAGFDSFDDDYGGAFDSALDDMDDDALTGDVPTVDALLAEVEKFLRDQSD